MGELELTGSLASSPLFDLPRTQVPFEEDDRDPKTWFLDLDYVEGMWEMFRKVNGQSTAHLVTDGQLLPAHRAHPAPTRLALTLLSRSQGAADRVLPHGAHAQVIGPRDLRAVQAFRAKAGQSLGPSSPPRARLLKLILMRL